MSDTKLRVLVPPDSVPDPEMITFLEQMIERAQTGELAGLVVVWERREGGSGYRAIHAKNSRPNILLGEVAVAQVQMAVRFARGDDE